MGLYNKNEDLTKYNESVVDDELDSIDDRMSDFGSNLLEQTTTAISHPFQWGFENLPTNKMDDLFSKTYDNMGSFVNMLGVPDSLSNSSRFRKIFDQPFLNDEIIQQGITGIYSYKAPTPQQYSSCLDVDGLSVWNSKGWWRCLFPKAVIQSNLVNNNIKGIDLDNNENNILTKENVELDIGHRKFGIFFNEYTDYLNWKSQMNKIVKQKQEQQQSKKLLVPADDHSFFSETPENLMTNAESSFVNDSTNKTIVGKSTYVTYNSTPEGKEKVKLWKTYYDDGTVNIKSEKKIKPADGGKKITEYNENTINVKDDK